MNKKVSRCLKYLVILGAPADIENSYMKQSGSKLKLTRALH